MQDICVVSSAFDHLLPISQTILSINLVQHEPSYKSAYRCIKHKMQVYEKMKCKQFMISSKNVKTTC